MRVKRALGNFLGISFVLFLAALLGYAMYCISSSVMYFLHK